MPSHQTLPRARPAHRGLRALAFLVLGACGVSDDLVEAPPLSYAQIAALPLARQAAILDPLRKVAAAVSQIGTTREAAVFSGVRLDAPAGVVHVYLTDPSRGDALLAAARAVDPGADLQLARVAQSAHSLQALSAARDAILAENRRNDMTIQSIAVEADGSELQVQALEPARARAMLATAMPPAAPIRVEPAAELRSMTRLRDQPPWIAGAGLSTSSTRDNPHCTSGLPARRISDRSPVLVTAAHCFGSGTKVTTGADPGTTAADIGVVNLIDAFDDAIGIDTSSTGITRNAEWDGPNNNVLAVNHVAFSYTGDMTCHDGYVSKVVCGLLVDNSSITWTDRLDGQTHRGVRAHQVDHLTAVQGGDSGGLVFSLDSTGNREARGIVSAGDDKDRTVILWTEAPFIFSGLSLELADATDPTMGAQASGAVVFNNVLYSFARGADHTIKYWFNGGGGWSAMQSVGAGIVSDPVATVYKGTLFVFGIAGDGTIKYWFGNGGPWSGTQSVGSGVSGGLSSTTFKGIQYLFARANDGRLAYWFGDGASPWSPTQFIGASVTGPVASTVYGNLLYVYAAAADGTIKYWFGNGGGPWSGMQTVGGASNGGVSSTGYNGYLYLFARGNDGKVKYWFGNGGPWSATQTIGGSVAGGVGSTVYNGTFYVFARGTSGNLVFWTANGGAWSAEQSLGGGLH